MQQLKERSLSNTPTDIPHVRSNCGLILNSPNRVRDSVSDLKTSFNNSDAALTPAEQGGRNLRVSVVYVLNQRRKPLMPCSPRTARILLKKGDAYVVKRTPFNLMLKKATGETAQTISLGVDSGFKNIGLSASSEKMELFAAEANLRMNIVNLNSDRRAYRRARRNRKTWYRSPRFLNRKKDKGWLAPSIQHKFDSHIKLIDKVASILPVTTITVEVAAFDIQKIQNPAIKGTDYQEGAQKDFCNVRGYVLYRDNHTCQLCKGKSNDKILNVHHIISRKTGGNRPGNLITLCKTCHQKYHEGKAKIKLNVSKGFKAETFMSMVRWKIIDYLRTKYSTVLPTFGYLTKSNRMALKISKSHINDAFIISGGNKQKRISPFLFKQVRKCNRKLHRGIRSHIKNTAPRFIHGFKLYDKVLYNKKECFIFGRRSTGYFDIKTASGETISASVNYKKIVLKERSYSFLIERKSDSSST